MNRARMMLLTAGLATVACAAYGADTGATSLLPADSASVFRLGGTSGEFAKMSSAVVAGQPFTRALRIEVAKKPQRSRDVQIAAPVDAAVASGDVLMVSFWMRSGTPAEATLDAGFRSAGGGFFRGPAPLNMPAVAGTTWKKVQLPFALMRAVGKGEGELYFTLGFREQTIEIGGIELLNYGTSKRVADLPFTRLGYGGSEPGAAWRKAAEARIEKIRKGDLTVVVKDAAGKPVPGAEVSVRMRKHAFLFGTAVSGPALSGRRLSVEDLAKYKQHILELFNCSVMENDLKWPQWSHESHQRRRFLLVVDPSLAAFRASVPRGARS